MQLHKTERARAELKPGIRTLGQRERTLLLLADGNKSVTDFRPLFDGDGEQIALRLLADGYLMQAASAAPPKRPTNTDAAATIQATPSGQPSATSADAFEGKRSLATTRMFLFDLCERMFARRSPVMAESFRQALRHAKDRETMLAVSRDMIEEIEKVAGHERADSISERLAMLLPSEAVTG